MPPQDEVNHSTTAPDPFEPPATVNVVEPPLQIVVVPVTPVGAVGAVSTVTVTLAQAVMFVQEVLPTLLAKYVVVDVGETVIELPVPAAVPPHELVNHCTVAPEPSEPPVTVKVVEPPLQIVVTPEMLVGAVGGVSTVTVTLAQAVVLVQEVLPTLLAK